MSIMSRITYNTYLLALQAYLIADNIATLGLPYKCSMQQFRQLDSLKIIIDNFILNYSSLNLDNSKDNNITQQYYIISLKVPLLDLLNLMKELNQLKFTCCNNVKIQCSHANKIKNQIINSINELTDLNKKLDTSIVKSHKYT